MWLREEQSFLTQRIGVRCTRVSVCVYVCHDINRWEGPIVLRTTHVAPEIKHVVVVVCGSVCMCNGRRIWCSANPLCNGAANPPPSPSSSLSPFLHTEVYIKALRKTITLSCTSPLDQSLGS